ncbi:MAG: hypothetical protein AAEJ04_02820 [Planctomycetota bacterium]
MRQNSDLGTTDGTVLLVVLVLAVKVLNCWCDLWDEAAAPISGPLGPELDRT